MGQGADATAEQAELEPGSDAALIAEGWATLTPLTGVREDLSEGGGSGPGRRPGHVSTAFRPGRRRTATTEPVAPG